MSRHVVVGLLAIFFFGLGTNAQAQIGIRPAYIELDLDEARPTGSFTVTNTLDKEVRIRVQALDFSFSSNGGLVAGATNEYSLAPMIKFNPKEFTLPPKASRAVRFSVIPSGKLDDGEYWAALGFEPLEENIVTQDQEDTQVTIDLRTGTLVPIYGQVGKVIHSANIKDVKADTTSQGITMSAVLANTGTGYLLAEASYQISDPAGTVLASGVLTREVVLRGSEQIFEGHCSEVAPSEGLKIRIEFKTKQLAEPMVLETVLSLDDQGE